MKYEEIHINDFGIFANAKLLDLNPNFNIIGGANRAGKTTLLKMLRYIAYGIPNKDIIPPARSNYDLEAILFDNKSRYSLQINGYANPKINDLNSPDNKIDNIFSDIDQFTYNQLFTITLEELKKIPKGVSDTEKLQSVLMGAGLKEYTLIPQLKDYFKGEARDVGGKYGKISVSDFKEYNQIIEEGVELKQEAQKQVKEYYNLKDDLENIEKDITQLDKEILQKSKEKDKLDLIKSNYNKIENLMSYQDDIKKEKYDKISSIKKSLYPIRAKELYENYKEVDSRLGELLEEYKELTGQEHNQEVENMLLEQSETINHYYNQISGLKERYNSISDQDNKLKEKYKNLKQEAASISETLADNLDKLLEVETTIEYKNELRQLVNDYEDITTKINNKKEEIDKAKREIAAQKEKKKELESDENKTQANKTYLYTAIGGALLITFLSFINLRFLGLLIIEGFIVYKYIESYSKTINYQTQIEEIQNNIKDMERKMIFLNDELDKFINQKDNIVNEIKQIKETINLKKDITPELLLDYYQDLLDVKSKFLEYRNTKAEQHNKKGAFKDKLLNIYEFLKQFKQIVSIENVDKDNIINNIELVKKSIEQTYHIKELLQQIKGIRKNKNNILEKLFNLEGMDLINKEGREVYVIVKDYQSTAELINEYKNKKEKINEIKNQLTNITEQTKNAFGFNNNLSQEELVEYFLKEHQKYISEQQVREEYNIITNKLNNLKEEIDKLKSKKEEIKLKMNNLATEDKLIKAEKKINRARNNMKPLADKFAINNMASHILEKYWQKFLNEKKDKLLNKASELMEQITSGEYKKIEPLESLTDPNFKVLADKGKVYNDIDHLSRGTREQLFMAIRINRIMEIEPSLPVIIDDSLVNFDPNHLRNIFDIINKLKNKNQIFFLTCHPEQIEFLDDKIDNKNFYSLVDGRFEKSNKQQLIEALN